jgi:hypothetical protein
MNSFMLSAPLETRNRLFGTVLKLMTGAQEVSGEGLVEAGLGDAAEDFREIRRRNADYHEGMASDGDPAAHDGERRH